MSKFSQAIFLSLLLAASPAMAVGLSSSPSYTSQYVKYRSEATKRTDPRLKHLPNSSKKANKCLETMMGVCTMTEPENYGRLRYNNSQRRNKPDTTKKLGFQGEEYWSN